MNSPRDIAIIGAGGSGREIYSLILDIERVWPDTWRVVGFLADDPPNPAVLRRLGLEYLGPATKTRMYPISPETCAVALGIGDPARRRAAHSRFLASGFELPALIHPTALIGPDVRIGGGTTIAAHCVLTTNIRVGEAAQLNIGCIVAHDCRIGDGVTLAQSVNIAGEVTVHNQATLYTRAVVNPRLIIGLGATVGAGSVVIADVPDGETVAGVPARPTTSRAMTTVGAGILPSLSP